MTHLTQAESDYRMDVASGRYRRQPDPVPPRDVRRFFEELDRGTRVIDRRAKLIMRALRQAETELVASPLMKGFEAFIEQVARRP